MVWPILLDADVFFAIDEEHAGRKYDEMIPSSENWSREAQSLFEPVYSARLRASESLAESMLLCRSLVLAREESRGGDRYEWILRLRPDAVYRRAVPPLSSWPRLRRDASVVWSTYVGGPGCSRSVPKEAEAKGVCLDDNFALMSRPAFEAYFGPWPKTGCRPEKCNECRLGCALHNASVRVGSLPIDFRLMRGPSKLNRTHDQDYELRTPLDQHADKVIAKYDLENRRHPSGDEERDADERRQIVANELVDLLTGHKVKEKHQLRFLVVEPCLGGEDEKNPSIAQFVYGDDESFADETILEADPPMVHGLLAPFAHRGNDWLGCNPPPIE